MRPLTVALACDALLAVALVGACMIFAIDVANSEPEQPLAVEAGHVAAQDCDPENVIVYQPNPLPDTKLLCTAIPGESGEIEKDRAYLIETASPGGTMTRQGPDLAIGRLHPQFVRRLASAIREARQAGLLSAGIFSAYRPPAFGVGGFSDKFNSLHTYGLAVDMSGIGRAGSAETQLWYEIAAKHGIVCPYGSENRVEWNHCQPTPVKIILGQSPLRETVTAQGPLSLEGMFHVGDALIERLPTAVASVTSDPSERPAPAQAVMTGSTQPVREEEIGEKYSSAHFASLDYAARSGRGEQLRHPPSWCRRLHRPRTSACGSSPRTGPAMAENGKAVGTPITKINYLSRSGRRAHLGRSPSWCAHLNRPRKGVCDPSGHADSSVRPRTSASVRG